MSVSVVMLGATVLAVFAKGRRWGGHRRGLDLLFAVTMLATVAAADTSPSTGLSPPAGRVQPLSKFVVNHRDTPVPAVSARPTSVDAAAARRAEPGAAPSSSSFQKIPTPRPAHGRSTGR